MAMAAIGLSQPTVGMIDTFQDGTTQNWGGGASPTNVPNSGPNGNGDNILQIIGAGGAGGASVPATHNELQWTGDFTVNGVKVVKVQYKNFSSTNLGMRLVLFGLLGSRWTSSEAFPLGGNSPWLTHYHVLTSGSMTRTLGSESYSSVMSLVVKMMLRNNTGAPSSGGTAAAATVGIDNVTALTHIPISAQGLNPISGLPFGGTVADTFTSDNNYYFLLNEENEPNGSLEFSFSEEANMIPTLSNWSQLRFIVEASATRDDLSLFVDLFNFNTNNYDSFGAGTSTLTDTTYTQTISSNTSRYVTGANIALRSRLRWIPQQDLEAADGWSEQVDLVQWQLSP